MVRLAGRFAGVLLVQVAPYRADSLADALTGLAGLTITVLPAECGDSIGERVRLSVLGNDRPGIVQKVSAIFAPAGINVETLKTTTRGAPVTGGQLFGAIAGLHVPPGVEIESVHAALE
jgi:glycine cleavage system regulatory protein